MLACVACGLHRSKTDFTATQLKKGELRKCTACTSSVALARTPQDPPAEQCFSELISKHGCLPRTDTIEYDSWLTGEHARYGVGDDVVITRFSGPRDILNGACGVIVFSHPGGSCFIRLARSIVTEVPKENLCFRRREDHEDRLKLTKLVNMYEEKASQLVGVCVEDAFEPIFTAEVRESLFPLLPSTWLANRYEAMENLSRKSVATLDMLHKFHDACINWTNVELWMEGWNALSLESREAMLCAAWDVAMRVLPGTYGDDGPAWCKQIVPEYGDLSKAMDVPAVIRMLQAPYSEVVAKEKTKLLKLNRAWRAKGSSLLPDTEPDVGHSARWAKINFDNCGTMFANLRLQYVILICLSLLEGVLKPSGLKRYKESRTVTDTCAICVEKFVDGELIRELDCKHVFHRDCIESWLPHNLACPLCRSGPEHAAVQNPGGHVALAHNDMAKRMGALEISLSIARHLKALW